MKTKIFCEKFHQNNENKKFNSQFKATCFGKNNMENRFLDKFVFETLPNFSKMWVQKLNQGQIFKFILEIIFKKLKCITCDLLKNKSTQNADDYLMMA